MRLADSRTFCTAGTNKPIRIAMMAMTTNSSIRVKPPRLRNRGQFMGVSFQETMRKAHGRRNPFVASQNELGREEEYRAKICVNEEATLSNRRRRSVRKETKRGRNQVA